MKRMPRDKRFSQAPVMPFPFQMESNLTKWNDCGQVLPPKLRACSHPTSPNRTSHDPSLGQSQSVGKQPNGSSHHEPALQHCNPTAPASSTAATSDRHQTSDFALSTAVKTTKGSDMVSSPSRSPGVATEEDKPLSPSRSSHPTEDHPRTLTAMPLLAVRGKKGEECDFKLDGMYCFSNRSRQSTHTWLQMNNPKSASKKQFRYLSLHFPHPPWRKWASHHGRR